MSRLTMCLTAPVLAASVTLLAPLPAAGQDVATDPVRAQALDALRTKDVARAVAAADRLLAKNPRDRDAAAIKIEALASANDWETALGAYDAFVRDTGRDDAALLAFVARAALREATIYYPSLRAPALVRLACAGDRDALLELKRATAGRTESLDVLVMRARMGEFDAVLELRRVATAGTPQARIAALQALQQLRDRGAEAAVVANLRHTDPTVRVTAARAARTLALDATSADLRLLLSDPYPLAAAEAAAALATMGADLTEKLTSYANHPAPEIRAAALAGLLARDANPHTLDAVRSLVAPNAGPAWGPAMELLAAHDRPAALQAVQDGLSSVDLNVKLQALRWLPRVPEIQHTQTARLAALLRELHPLVRMEAAAAVAGPGGLCSP